MSPSRTTMINVNEYFGPTIQGEGRMAGHLCSFLRLSGCNLSCSWCDTPYTWDWSRFNHSDETRRMSVEDVSYEMDGLPGRIIISGGEPLLQSRALSELMTWLPAREFDVETNGTRPLGLTEGRWANVTCSPKIIPSADQDPVVTAQIHPSVAEVADFKFVIRDDLDLLAVLLWLDDADNKQITNDRVWLMPEGTTAPDLTERTPFVMEQATNHGFNFTTRLHVYGWHDVRGH